MLNPTLVTVFFCCHAAVSRLSGRFMFSIQCFFLFFQLSLEPATFYHIKNLRLISDFVVVLFFLGFIGSCLSYFITGRDHFHLCSQLSAVHSYYLYHIHLRFYFCLLCVIPHCLTVIYIMFISYFIIIISQI